MRLTPILTVILLLSPVAHAAVIVNATVNSQLQTCSNAGSVAYDPSNNRLSYACTSDGLSHACTPTADVSYALSSTTVNVTCANAVVTGLQVDVTFGGVQNGDGAKSGSTPGNVCSNATNVAFVPGTNTFSWTCGSFNGACQPIETTVFDLAQNRISAICAAANPTGIGLANPATVAPTGSTNLTVAVTNASNPTSTGITVVSDLSSIGGSAAQAFLDDGQLGDASAGDGVFTYAATLPLNATAGAKSLVVTVADAQLRSSTTNIALNVLASTAPTGYAQAAPGSVAATGSTLLTVQVNPGTNPNSSGIGVVADLSAIGGSPNQVFFDNGSNDDAVAGDGTFSFRATLPYPTAGGAKSLPVTIADAQLRSSLTSIDLNVLPATNPTGFAIATPDNVAPNANTLLTVRVKPGTNPLSTTISVVADLSAIGGGPAQIFSDNGSNGDATAGDGVFSFTATLGAATPIGSKALPVTVSDTQSRSSATAIAMNVIGPDTLVAVGHASPNPVTVGKTISMWVTVTPASAPTSTGIAVSVDMTAFGGSPTQVFFDDGSNGDFTAGDNIFTFATSAPVDVPSGPLRLPVNVTDAQARTATTGIVFDVRGDDLFDEGFEE